MSNGPEEAEVTCSYVIAVIAWWIIREEDLSATPIQTKLLDPDWAVS